MTGAQAIAAAAKFFTINRVDGDAREIYLEEFSGSFQDIKNARVRVHYCDRGGDYVESDRNPYVVMVAVNEEGKIETWRLNGD